jgi:SAM-dependent methyltransferase
VDTALSSSAQTQLDSEASGATFDAAYYESHCGSVPYTRSQEQWPVFFGSVADHLIRSLRPARVLDIGCALGFLVEAFWDRGVEAWGVDISAYAIANVRPDMRDYCRLGSATQAVENGPYDLITCIEVLEHMPEADARLAVECMTAANATNTILFSSSPTDFEERTHVNVRPPLYWLQTFQEHGFTPDILFDASFLAPHAMLLRRRAPSHPAEVLRLYAGLLRLRSQLTERNNRYNEAARDLGLARAENERAHAHVAAVRSELDLANSDRERSRTEAAEAHRAVSEKSARISELEVQLEAANRRTEEMLAMNDQARQDLDAAAARLTSYIAERNRGETSDRQAAQNMQTEVRLGALETRLANVNSAVNSILQSRIWRTLVRAGGYIGGIAPGTGRK